MKVSLFALIFSVLIVACNTEVKSLGKPFTESDPMSIDALLHKAKEESHIEDAQVSGVIYKSCRSEGCWFTIKDKNGVEVYLDIKEKNFKMPLNSPERQVVALVNADTSSESTSGVLVDVKGIMFK